MNYRHAYHAGNFADVMKHIALVACITHLKKKATPFRVIDTHAGIGRYRLDVAETDKTGEWRDGIARVLSAIGTSGASPEAVALIKPYLDLIAAEAGQTEPLSIYPGSPRIAAALLRRGDTLIANELHPDDGKRLTKLFDDDRQVKVTTLDGWHAIKALLPPPERRGVILIDPPFEASGEFQRMTEGLKQGLERFRDGTYLLWYPIKELKPSARFHRGIVEVATAAGVETVLAAELLIRAPRNPDLLNGCGLVIVNPPYTLRADLGVIYGALADWVAQGPGAKADVYPLLPARA
jgi:23S rRNA (adenine2030-N6)-methyltransferase